MLKADPDLFLLSSSNAEWVDGLHASLTAQGLACHKTISGKETQTQLYRNKYSGLILDLEITNHSAIEILKYIKLSHQSLKVMLYVREKKLLENLDLDEGQLRKLGILSVLQPNTRAEQVLQALKQWTHATSWRQVRASDQSEQKESRILDKEFTRMKITEALELNIAAFDSYIRLGMNKYVKVVHQGEPFPKGTIQNYASSGGEYLYFLTRDREVYINFMNELAQKMLSHQIIPAPKIMRSLKNTTDKFIEEVHTAGIHPALVVEGKRICQSMFDLVSKDKNLDETLKSFQEYDASAYSHSFLVSFYSVVICKNLDWVGSRTIETLALGSLLHDIGTLKLPKGLKDSQGKDLTARELELYREHPRLGAEMLQSSRLINEQVRQIIYQHHEHVTGTGYPNGLTGIKIYPLAKIVALADGFTQKMVEIKAPPKQAMRSLLQDREDVSKFDSNILRSLVLGITQGS